jgi:hypothetical protein
MVERLSLPSRSFSRSCSRSWPGSLSRPRSPGVGFEFGGQNDHVVFLFENEQKYWKNDELNK